MINLLSSSPIVYGILKKAILRNHGKFNFSEDLKVYCFISPSIKDEEIIKQLVYENTKILIFGKISEPLASFIGLKYLNSDISLEPIIYDHNNIEDKSNLYIQYQKHELNKNNPLKIRYFHRFDFTNEWNNLGYGPIKTDNDIWSISQPLEIRNAELIASIYDNDNEVSIFASVKDFEKSSVLYINREVATVDGLDWTIVEEFLSFYRKEELPSLPIIEDIPYGCEAVASSRLDCDQSIINTQQIVELYKRYNIDISLAVATGINIEQKDIDFLNDFYDNGGSILSHTINHHYFWGENYEICNYEASGSKEWLEKNIINLENLKYAVSPFHSNKLYSIQALKDSGYEGFISGIIHNDPEYLIATSGEVPFVDGKIVSHSQQCMLHGDSYHRRKNSIDIEKESFKNHYKAKKIFGYLDHPFGDYNYGWRDEIERLSVHEEFIQYVNRFKGVKWMTCTEILDFVVDKSNLEILIDENDELILKRNTNNSKEKIKVIYKDKEYIC